MLSSTVQQANRYNRTSTIQGAEHLDQNVARTSLGRLPQRRLDPLAVDDVREPVRQVASVASCRSWLAVAVASAEKNTRNPSRCGRQATTRRAGGGAGGPASAAPHGLASPCPPRGPPLRGRPRERSRACRHRCGRWATTREGRCGLCRGLPDEGRRAAWRWAASGTGREDPAGRLWSSGAEWKSSRA